MTTTAYEVGQRVRFLGIDPDAREAAGVARSGAGCWELLSVGALGTVEEIVPEDPNKLFVVFDDVEMPLAWLADILGQSRGWPILAAEVELQ